MENQTVYYDTTVTLNACEYEKEGYTFNGWATSGAATEATYKDEESILNLTTTDGDIITLYAIWVANEYTIEYNANGGTGTIGTTSATYDTGVSLSENEFTKTGYTFAGWNTEADGSGTSYEDGATVSNLTTEDGATVTLYAQWEPVTYTIVFDGNGADDGEMESIDATYDETYTLTANAFSRNGYKFTGWNTEADGSGTSYEDEATVSNLTTEDGATVTLYAQWEESYTLSYDYTLKMKSTSQLTARETTSVTHSDSSDGTTDLLTLGNYSTKAAWSGYTYADTAAAEVSLEAWNDGESSTLLGSASLVLARYAKGGYATFTVYNDRDMDPRRLLVWRDNISSGMRNERRKLRVLEYL